MLKLVIGGYAQGKLSYVLQKYFLQENPILLDGGAANGISLSDGGAPDGISLTNGIAPDKTVIINHFHEWVKSRMQKGGCPEEEMQAFLERHSDCIIISSEIGNGIVPMDAFEREYRERMGRLLVQLAKQAEEVERVICGFGQKIK